MKIFRPLILLLFLSYSLFLNGQSVLIKGSGKGYNNIELKFFVQTDPVTKRLKPLAKVRCDGEGKFSFSPAVAGRTTIFIRTGIYKFHLYVTEGAVYELSLPDYIPRTGIEEQELLFIETEMIPEVLNNQQDINNLVRVFDSEYNPVFNFAAESVFRNYRKDEMQKQIAELENKSKPGADPFYNDYVKCRMIMLHLVASSAIPTQALAVQFINSEFKFENQAFTDLADQMFSGYFNTLSSGSLKDPYNRAIAIASFPELESVIMKDKKFTNKELADYVILLNLNSGYYERTLPGENVRKIISLMKSQGESGFIKNIASELLGRINLTLPGNYPPALTLEDSNGKMINLTDFKGKYLLLGFARADNVTSVSELGIIKMWQNKYAGDLNVVTVLTDDNYKTASGSIKKYGFNWTFLNGSERDQIEFLYDIKMYPFFMLLDREGKIFVDPCPFPSEDLDAAIGRILKAEVPRSRSENR